MELERQQGEQSAGSLGSWQSWGKPAPVTSRSIRRGASFGLVKESSAHLVVRDGGLAEVDECSIDTSRKRYPKLSQPKSLF
jgi:hypothetical protein